MKRKTFSNIIRKLKRLDAESSELIGDLSSRDPLIMGSLSEVMRTCGKPNCHCAQKPCHRHMTLMTTHKSTRRCQVIRKADVEEVRLKVHRYRGARDALRRLKAVDKERYALVKALLEARNELYE